MVILDNEEKVRRLNCETENVELLTNLQTKHMGSIIRLRKHHLIFMPVIQIRNVRSPDRKVEDRGTRFDYVAVSRLRNDLCSTEAVLRICDILSWDKDGRVVDRDGDCLLGSFEETARPERSWWDSCVQVDVLFDGGFLVKGGREIW